MPGSSTAWTDGDAPLRMRTETSLLSDDAVSSPEDAGPESAASTAPPLPLGTAPKTIIATDAASGPVTFAETGTEAYVVLGCAGSMAVTEPKIEPSAAVREIETWYVRLPAASNGAPIRMSGLDDTSRGVGLPASSTGSSAKVNVRDEGNSRLRATSFYGMRLRSHYYNLR